MKYVVGTLAIQSDFALPFTFDAFRADTDAPEHAESRHVTIVTTNAAPDLSAAVCRAAHELMTVWETPDAWIFEGKNAPCTLTISRDYTHAACHVPPPCGQTELQPLLQALVECCLIHAGTAVIHAACISINGEAVLFSGPSGTGKSTRAQRWVEQLGASWISGDRPAVQPLQAIAHGVPWDGKDQMFIHTSAPIRMIAEIRRSGTTYARAMTLRQKRAFLSAQLLIPMWDTALAQKAFLSMQQMIHRLPICRLYCDITQDSIEQAYQLLFQQPDTLLEAKEETTMQMKKDFTIVEVGGDYMAIPNGENTATFGGAVVLNEVTAFLLKAMNKPVTEEDLVELMLNEYDIDRATAAADLKEILATLADIGLVE